MLTVLDRQWREHLYEMDYLKEGIHLRQMAQRDPLVEYQREGYQMFEAMNDGIKEESAQLFFHVQVDPEEIESSMPAEPAQTMSFIAPNEDGAAEEYLVADDGHVMNEEEQLPHEQRRAAAKKASKKSGGTRKKRKR